MGHLPGSGFLPKFGDYSIEVEGKYIFRFLMLNNPFMTPDTFISTS